MASGPIYILLVQDISGLSIEEKLEVLLPASFSGTPPELAPILSVSPDACYLDGPDAPLYVPVRLSEGSQSRFCCPGFLPASGMVYFERQVRIQPDAKPECRMPVEPYEPVADPYLGCQLSPQVCLVASSGCQ